MVVLRMGEAHQKTRSNGEAPHGFLWSCFGKCRVKDGRAFGSPERKKPPQKGAARWLRGGVCDLDSVTARRYAAARVMLPVMGVRKRKNYKRVWHDTLRYDASKSLAQICQSCSTLKALRQRRRKAKRGVNDAETCFHIHLRQFQDVASKIYGGISDAIIFMGGVLEAVLSVLGP